MLKHFLILVAILSIHVYNVKSEDAFHFDATIFQQSDNYFLHTIERGQTLYSISKMYNVSIESITKLNPDSKNGITAGQTLKIPQTSGSFIYHTILPKETLYSVSKKYYMTGEDVITANPGLSVETFTIGKIIRIPTNKVTTPIEGPNETKKQDVTNALLTQNKFGSTIGVANVALLLPFDVEESDNGKKRRFTEYYEGFLMALDSLKRTGISVNLQVYDIGQSNQALTSILQKEDMKKTHIIIGGFTDEQIKLISDFSKKQDIPYVIPFTAKSEIAIDNPNVFQINTPHSYLYAKTAAAFARKYKKHNIIFINDENGDKMDFVNVLQAELKQSNIPYKTVAYGSAFRSQLQNLLSNNQQNVIVPVDASSETLMKIVSPLQIIKQTNPTTGISLFGYSEWQKYSQDYLNDFFSLNASIYSVFYADNTSPEVKNFYNKFKKTYSKNLLDTYPKYGILGFDTGMYFLKGLAQYGTSLEMNVNNVNYEGIQIKFQFERINNWSGFYNSSIYFVSFNPNNTITKDFQN